MKKPNERVIRLRDLPQDLRMQMRATPFEIENSARTNRQNYVLVRRTLVIKGELYNAELRIGNCDIRQSPEHYYDDTIGVFFDAETGREKEPRIYSRDKASDLYCTSDLDECYITLSKIDNEATSNV